jgi:hypothetical protein
MRPVGWRIESDQSKTHGLRAVDSIFRISRSWVLELQPFENKTRRHAVQFALTGRSGASVIIAVQEHITRLPPGSTSSLSARNRGSR